MTVHLNPGEQNWTHSRRSQDIGNFLLSSTSTGYSDERVSVHLRYDKAARVSVECEDRKTTTCGEPSRNGEIQRFLSSAFAYKKTAS